MQYGYYDDARKEYVITTPFTPLPWINYLGSENLFGTISNLGGGYTFWRDARLLRLLRYRYNAVPADEGGRFFYIQEEGKEPWSPAFQPCRTPLDRYECRHGLGYTMFSAGKDDLTAQLKLFIPLGDACEIQDLTLRNDSREEKRIQVWGCVEWCLYDAVDDAQNYQRNLNIAESEQEPSLICHTTEYRERRNHYAWYGVNAETTGFDTDRNAFLGPMGTWARPLAVRERTSYGSRVAGWYPIACHRLDVTLAPGESFRAAFLLGFGENPREAKFGTDGRLNRESARRAMERYATGTEIDAAFEALSGYWTELLSRFQLHSGEEKLDRMANIWHQYQCMVTFNMSRSASSYETGTGRGMGFRDSCQDIFGFVHIVPERARERILDLASVQLPDGSAYHQYQPLTRRGNSAIGSGFHDDPLWLVAAAVHYLKETGDFSILSHPTPFDCRPGTEVPLMEHLRRSVGFTARRLGPHGLPLIGRADWNDCLNLNCFSDEPGESFQTTGASEGPVAESVFIAAMFVKYGREYARLCERMGLSGEAESVRKQADDMEAAVLAHGWDGAWFLRAYDAFGAPVGSSVCPEGKIFVEPQAFCVMAGIGVETGQARKALDSVRKYLLGEYGVELLAPCYTRYHRELGEITSYPPGFKENGSVFCHCNPWVVCAEAELGRGNEAFDIYRRICPAWLEERSEVHEAEPYCYAQTVTGRATGHPGHAKNSWLTGTASWAFLSLSQAILGIRPDYDGLEIRPCLPDFLKEYTVERQFRDVHYRIHVKQTGRYSLTVDGKPVPGSRIPLPEQGGGTVAVEVQV